jgi:hypothetical protein
VTTCRTRIKLVHVRSDAARSGLQARQVSSAPAATGAKREKLLRLTEDRSVSIVRIGLAETRNFAEGYDAIFGKKRAAAPATAKPAKKATAAKAVKTGAAKKKKKAVKKK